MASDSGHFGLHPADVDYSADVGGENMVDLNKMTKKEFLDIPVLENPPPVVFDSFVIIPTGRAHESHFGCMRYVLLRGGEILGAVGGWSDMVRMEGVSWLTMDCLRTSRLIHVFVKCDLEMPWPVHSDFYISRR